jgi:MerR family mercuric resistance operon transcriptional regulator
MATARRQFTIGQLARAAQIPSTTVRYYERIGLLVPEERTAGNYRLYGDQSLGRLQFIRAAQAIGFALSDVAVLLGMDGRIARCPDVQSLIAARLADVAQRLEQLHHVQRVLKSALARCRQNRRADCHVLESLPRCC